MYLKRPLSYLLFFLFSNCLVTTVTAQNEASLLLDSANALWKAEEYRSALKIYKKAFDTAPKEEKNTYKVELNEAYTNYSSLLMDRESNEPTKSARNFQVASIYYKKHLNSVFGNKNDKAYKDSLMRFQLIVADAYFKSEQYQAAGRTYKKVLKQYIKNEVTTDKTSEIYLLLAQCYVELKNYSNAGKMYGKGYQNIDLANKAEELYCKGYYLEAGRLLSYLRNGIEETSEKDLYSRLIARSYFKAGVDESARYWYKQCLDENNLIGENAVINFNQNCESCDQLLNNKGYFISMLKEPGQLDIDRFYFAQVQLNLSGKFLEASNLINNATIIYHSCEDEAQPCFDFEKTFQVSKLTSEGINTGKSSEYSPMYFENDTLIFASDRNPLKEKREEVNGEERSTFDLYQQRMNETDVFGYHPEIQVLHVDSLSQTSRFFTFDRGIYYNEGPMAFYPGTKNKFIFTGNSFTKTDSLKRSQAFESDRINTLKLFSAEWSSTDSIWNVTPILFEGLHAELFNSELFSVAHPTFNTNGTELYFSSDVPMPGTNEKMGNYGNTDIFKSTFDPNTGKLGTPENLGTNINSEGNELFPYLYTSENGEEVLYFSSNFHEEKAQGQLDIYYAGFCNGSFGARKNMGIPINSDKDDFGLVLNKKGTAGYLSSDREGSDDIYKFRELQILITVLEKGSNKVVSGAIIEFMPSSGAIITGAVPSGGTTRYRDFDLDSKYDVNIKPNTEIYFPNGISFSTPIEAFDAYGIYRDTIYLEKKPKVKMIVMANVKSWQQVFVAFDKNTGTLGTEDSIKGSSDFSLLYEFSYDAEKGQNYLQSTLDGTVMYLRTSQLFSLSNLEDESKQEQLKKYFINNHILVPTNVQSNGKEAANPIVIRNIRYGFDSSNFSKKDAENIDPDTQFRKMAGVLYDYKHLRAKMSSHTDECPFPPYTYDNLALSGRRSTAAREGLLKYYSDLDTARLELCRYDGTYPIDQSPENYSENGRGQNCANQYNRRTEFKLLYVKREKYTEDCDCLNESMIRPPKNEGSSSIRVNSTTQGGR